MLEMPTEPPTEPVTAMLPLPVMEPEPVIVIWPHTEKAENKMDRNSFIKSDNGRDAKDDHPIHPVHDRLGIFFPGFCLLQISFNLLIGFHIKSSGQRSKASP